MSGYIIKEHKDYFQVFAQERHIERVTVRDGNVRTERHEYTQFFGISRAPSIFDAEYEGQGYWTIDLDCGAQRWRGVQSTREVRGALRKCDFDTETINALLAKYTAEKDGEPQP